MRPLRKLLLYILPVLLTFASFSQSLEPINGTGPGGTAPFTNLLNCNGTPTFIVDLTGNPGGTWTSNPERRAGNCCDNPLTGTVEGDNNCVQFSVTLDPGAEGIIFSVPDGCGAAPSGSLFYQVGCGPLTSVGTPLCLNGTGPFTITFCKPGNNDNCYSITSIPAPSSSGDVVTADGCRDTLSVFGVTPASTSWTSISPGTVGQYNGYLNSLAGTQPGVAGTTYTGQTTVVVTPQPGFPPSIQYRVCGTVIGACSTASFCDTVTVSIYPTLFASPGPDVAICNGSVVGAPVSATAIGGTAPYTYTWTGPGGFSDINTHGSTTDNIQAMLPGVYNVTISDATGCPSASTFVTVTSFNVDIIANAGLDIVVCRTPVPIVSINASVSATNAGIWSGGSGTYNANTTDLTLSYTPSAAELAAGTATLTLTPTNTGGCPFTTDQVTISLPQFTSALSAVPSNITCNGLINGSVNLTITPGTPAYTTSSVSWSNGPTTEDISGLGVGSYTATVTDQNGCVNTATANITQPPVLTASLVSQINVTCNGLSNGSAVISATGGTAGYQVSWSGAASGNPAGTEIAASGGNYNITGLIAGVYTLTITDANGCTSTVPLTITQPAVLTSALVSQINVTCNGLSNGSAVVSATGGTAGYQVSWSGAASGNPAGTEIAASAGTYNITGLIAGVYTVTITDANGCTSTVPLTITQPAVLTSALVSQINVTCNGLSNGSAVVSATGGTAGYQVSWSGAASGNPAGTEIAASAGTYNITGLIAGVYTVTITDDQGCTTTVPLTITQPAVLDVQVTASSNETCSYSDNGSVTVAATGGTGAYTYAITAPAAVGPQGSGTFSGLTGTVAGTTYTIQVTDAAGCTDNIPQIITEPVVLDVQVTAS
ncbi:MAG: beta strand repeat-containing protein, partial [Flavobacteriia bacterium]